MLNKKRLLVYAVVGVVGLLILVTPMFIHNATYKNIALGNDTDKIFIPMINEATNGASLWDLSKDSLYLGLALLMWGLGMLNRLLQLNPAHLFYIYTVFMLGAVSMSLLYFGKVIGGEKTGWITLVMGMFCSTTITALATIGATVNIINVFIIFLWAVILFAKWYEKRKWYYIAGGLVLLVLFSILHPTGAYLPATLLVLFGVSYLWLLVKDDKPNWKIVGLTFVVLVGSYFLTKHGVEVTGSDNPPLDMAVYGKDLLVFLVPAPTAIAIMTGVYWWQNRRLVQWDKATRAVLLVLGCLLIALLGTVLLRITVIPERQVVDASAIFAIITAIVLGNLMKYKVKGLAYSYLFMAIGSYMTIMAWAGK